MFKCLYCDKTYDGYASLARHATRLHKIDAKQFYVDYYFGGNWPCCKCGCDGKLKWHGNKKNNFGDYLNGHRDTSGENNPHYGKKHSPEAIESISKTRKAKFASGETKVWCEGLKLADTPGLQIAAKKISENKERAEKISKALMGRPHSEEHNRKSRIAITKAWKNVDLRNKQSARFKIRLINRETKLETNFKDILESLNIPYDFQYIFMGYIFDFRIRGSNILIEVDGDFYHCNPNMWSEPIYDVQKTVVTNDAKKNKMINEQTGFILYRFWEDDVDNKQDMVIAKLTAIMSFSI